MNLSWFAHIVVHHPYIIISAVSVVSGTCLIIPFTLKNVQFPSFQDPQLGFSTRGTTISNRMTTYNNLIKSTKPSGQLVINPKEVLLHRNYTSNKLKEKKISKVKKKNKNQKQKYNNIYVNDKRGDNFDNTTLDKWQQIKNLFKDNNKLQPPAFNADGFFCGYPDERYAHVVVQSINNEDLFNTNSLLSICMLEKTFKNANYRELCIENSKLSPNDCCRPWSLPNYVAILNNRTSCSLITDKDVLNTKELLISCSEYFHNFDLANCFEKDHCDIPVKCMKHDAVFNILNFLTNIDFLPKDNSTDVNGTKLLETMIFLPLASSTAMLPYFYEIQNLNLEINGIKVVAMDFGVKSALFDQCLLRDTWSIGFGAAFIFFCIWIYTKSLFLTLMTIITIIFSMGIAYFFYVVVFEIKFFPFMNLLAIVVALGIGGDDAFIFCKIWEVQKRETSSSLVKIMTKTFEHALVSMFVTTLTTSVAFFGSYVSNCIAIRCFSIFAGTITIINYLLMLIFFPACVILYERSYCSNITIFKTCLIACFQKWFCIRIIIKPKFNLSSTFIKCTIIDKLLGTNRDHFLFDMIIKLRYFWITLFFILAIVSGVVVLYYPKLQLPNTSDIQLFDSKHPFEQYDLVYRDHFYFRRSATYKLPLRFIWGVLPIDNGDHLDPSNLGSITLDPNFDMSTPESQVFLKDFCENLRKQPFYEPMPGTYLSNCFVETFIKSMQRECIDEFTNKNHSPCCKTSVFPYDKNVFNECIIEEMAEIYRTPEYLLMSGMTAGPKFSKNEQHPTIKAIVVEYDSNYSFTLSYDYMNKFYTEVDQWMHKQLESAPKSMQNGFFTSDLYFYDLQRELSSSTLLEIFISMGLALIVLLFSTLNIISSLFAVITITCIIFVSISILVLIGWKLGILESVAISTAIGLAVDFSLHYSVNYRLCPDSIKNDRIAATRFSLSHMAGPALMAAVTTGAAGTFMLRSLILPYIQIGIFLLTIMTISYIYATFFLGSLLAVAGPQGKMGQFSFKCLKCSTNKSKPSSSTLTNSERNRSLPTSVQDTHELDALTCKIDFKSTNKKLQRSLSSGVQYTPNKFVFTDQSPSATSAITIIMADDN